MTPAEQPLNREAAPPTDDRESQPTLPLAPASPQSIIAHAVNRAKAARGKEFAATLKRQPSVGELPSPFIERTILSEQYYKIRPSYVLVSGLLLSWTLIGLQVNPHPFQTFNITLIRPETSPIGIVLLVIYFSARYWLHWYQLAETPGGAPGSFRTDYFVTHLLALIALLSWMIHAAGSISLQHWIMAPQAVVGVVAIIWLISTRLDDLLERVVGGTFLFIILMIGLTLQAFDDLMISIVGEFLTGLLIGGLLYKLFAALCGFEKYSVHRAIATWRRQPGNWLRRLLDRVR